MLQTLCSGQKYNINNEMVGREFTRQGGLVPDKFSLQLANLSTCKLANSLIIKEYIIIE